MIIPIYTKLITLNEYIEAERANRFSAAKIKASLTTACMVDSLSYRGQIDPDKLYDLSLFWETKDNRQDPDNIFFGVKFILDGLIAAKIINKDGRKNIRNIYHNITTTGRSMVSVGFMVVC